MTRISCWQVFRLIFVVFSLYLMRDAFSRWDGFSYYASFSEFLPSIALTSILWSLISVFTAIFMWMLFGVFKWFCRRLGIEIGTEHLLLYTCFFVLSGAVVWKGKKVIWPYEQTTLLIKLVVFIVIVFVSGFFIWFFRNKAEKWMGYILEIITPLVWLFGAFVIVSVPVVFYHEWLKESDKTASGVIRIFESDKAPPNIILVTFDALAARNMSLYGYHRATTPFIGKWAENATVFTKAEAESNFTASTTASLMTGKRVWTHQTYHMEGTKPVKSYIESLPFLLKKNGYFNVALVVNPFASVKILGVANSFDIAPLASDFSTSASLFGWKFGIVDVMLYRAFGEKIRQHNWVLKNDFFFGRLINLISRNITQTTVPPEKAFNRFLEIINSNLPEPFFAWIHIFPPHDPYLPPEPYKGGFNPSSEFREYKIQEDLIEESYKYLFQYQPFPEEMQPAVDVMKDYYDEFIKYIDKEFENFMGELNNRIIENTVIILSADHGESFTHGYFTHGGPFLYEQATHIPLVIKEPLQNTGQVVSDLVEQIDIAATILDLAYIPAPSWMEGRSLVPLMRGEKLFRRHAFSMNFEENRSSGHEITRGSIAVWEDDYKLIHYLERNESLLFDLNQDPDELYNLFYEETEIGQHLLRLIQDNLAMINKRIAER